MDNLDQLRTSFFRYVNHQSDAQETRLFLEHLQSGKDEAAVIALIEEYLDSPVSETDLAGPEVLASLDRSFIAVQNRINDIPKKRRLFSFPHIAAAAAILLVSAAALFLYIAYSTSEVKNSSTYANDVAPGKNGATLTLANGKQIRLSDALEGELANEAGVTISKTADGQIVYHIQSQDQQVANNINTLSTQKGETYMVILPDQSKVWLNAASTLKYPSKFSGKERLIQLNGEAYFEVAKAKIPHSRETLPFRVLTASQTVEVLGTHFNINAYADQSDTRTTLLEGSVRIASQSAKDKGVMLVPGQQSVLKESDRIRVTKVNLNKAIAWKNGKFIFDNESIEDIMQELSRWYDVEISYQGDVSNRIFTGSMSRKMGLAAILAKISYTEAVHFKIEGRRVTVMP